MIKILHSADWHLDSPMSGHSTQQADELRQQLRKIPEKIARLCVAHCCDMVLLSGDLFDGVPTRESVKAVKDALASVNVPVIITPGNHDFCTGDSPYLTEQWPQNVHIFTKPEITAMDFSEYNCTIYGAGYQAMDCPGLLKNFTATGNARWKIGVLHGEANNATSNYCPITRSQLQDSNLDYLALGHIHKAGAIQGGKTICAWPGCPMGRGFDELGPKGVLILTLDQQISAAPIMLDTPRFYDEEIEAGENALATLSDLLPGVESTDYYRITLTGYSAPLDLDELRRHFEHIPNLILRDETVPEMDLWQNIGEDSLEGLLFAQLKAGTESESETASRRAALAARICRRILDGQEVKLP